jgi:hypothetical protein
MRAPGVHQFKDSFLLLSLICLDEDFFGIQNCVGMLRDQTKVPVSIIVLTRTGYQMIFVEMVIQEVPSNFIVDFLRRVFTEIFIGSTLSMCSKPYQSNLTLWPDNYRRVWHRPFLRA